ncbi:MAG: outer membrane protein transport protein [Steroidobacteraceae bacterium]
MNKIAAVVALVLISGSAHATNGYFSHGYGIKAKGEAGAGIASPQDSLAIATNPAGIALVGDEFDVGLDFFFPSREATFEQGGISTTYSGNDKGSFVIPDAGVSWALNDRLSLGIALFGNGGMNTDYKDNPYGRFGAQGKAGVDLSQAFLSPAIAWKLTDTQTIGLAVNFAYQRFEAKGIGIFGGFSTDPANVSNRGYDSSTGWGVRLGWIGKFGQYVTLGATWQSETGMGKFAKYSGLFADHGGFDIPQNFGLGIAVQPSDAVTVALDWQRILYSEVPSVGNPVDSLFSGVPLGAKDGPGFGWDDIDVFKLGTRWQVDDHWTLRGGVSYATQPIPASQTFFNTLAPGVVQWHLTLGGSYAFGESSSINAYYLHAFKNTVDGQNSIPPAFGGGDVNISLEENSFGIGYSYRF